MKKSHARSPHNHTGRLNYLSPSRSFSTEATQSFNLSIQPGQRIVISLLDDDEGPAPQSPLTTHSSYHRKNRGPQPVSIPSSSRPHTNTAAQKGSRSSHSTTHPSHSTGHNPSQSKRFSAPLPHGHTKETRKNRAYTPRYMFQIESYSQSLSESDNDTYQIGDEAQSHAGDSSSSGDDESLNYSRARNQSHGSESTDDDDADLDYDSDKFQSDSEIDIPGQVIDLDNLSEEADPFDELLHQMDLRQEQTMITNDVDSEDIDLWASESLPIRENGKPLLTLSSPRSSTTKLMSQPPPQLLHHARTSKTPSPKTPKQDGHSTAAANPGAPKKRKHSYESYKVGYDYSDEDIVRKRLKFSPKGTPTRKAA